MKALNLISGLETPLADVRRAFSGALGGGLGPWGGGTVLSTDGAQAGLLS